MTCPSQNLNFLTPNGFRFSVERLPIVSFFTQSITLPGVSLGDVGVGTPLSHIPIPDSKMEFQPLIVPFIVDSGMTNWFEAFKWIQGLGFPQEYPQYTTEQLMRGYETSAELPRNYSDAFLTVLGPHNTPVKTFRFVDCFPIALEGISFASTNTDVQYVTSQMTLIYSYFKLDE